MRSQLRWIMTAFLALICAGSGVTHANPLPAALTLVDGWQLQDSAQTPDNGEAISSPAYRPTRWLAATVPGTVLTSLVNDHVYPEPLYGMNVWKIPDLSRKSYWYRDTFKTPASYAGRHIWLRFDGINYAAEVWVNGVKIGAMRGAFSRGIFDVTSAVRPGASNAVAVKITAPPHPSGGISNPSNPVRQTLQNGYGPNGGNLEGDGPTFFDSIGWDWMPTIPDRDMGIWQDVSLSATGPVVIDDPYVTSTLPLPSTASADLTLKVDLGNVTNSPIEGVLSGAVDGRAFSEKVDIPAGQTKSVTLDKATAPALHLDHPKLWWPNGYGSAHLYTMPLTFTVAGHVSDSRGVTFGVRTISYGTENGSGPLKLTVNGVPIMIRGGDWGMDEAMKRSPESRLEAQIRLQQRAGFTMLRNWCGQTTQEDFYALCDKYGILVWNDFWLDDTVNYPIDAETFLANERETLLRYRQHPCIALWCERNEFPVGPPFEKRILALVHDLDPDRWMQPCSSSQFGVGDGDYGMETVEHYFQPYKDVFHTETGAPSIPTLEALNASIPPSDWGSFNDDWTEHDMCQFNYFPALTSRFGPIEDTADFVRKAQLADNETYRAIFEGRNARMFDPYTGVMIWMSNPAQPSLVWQIYSYDLEPDSAYFGAMHACEMVHVQMTPTGQVQVINNTPREQSDLKVAAAIYDLNGKRVAERSTVLSAGPSAPSTAFQIEWPNDLTPVHFVKLTLTNASGKLVSTNFYWHTTTGQDCSLLQTLPTASIDVKASRRDVHGRMQLTTVLSNRTNAVALMAHLQLRRSTGGRVLPVYYSDNYVSLLPGESRTVTIEAAVADLHDAAPVLFVDGWNVTAAAWNGRGVSVRPNVDTGLAHVPIVRNIDCGVGWLPGYAADCDYTGGNYAACDDVIDTSGVPMAAPPLLYRTERNGPCTYKIPAARGRTYTVVLHFAETYWAAPGKRVFNVDINGRPVLKNFDILASAGRKDRAVVKAFRGITSDSNGHIVIDLTKGSADQPKIDGIQVIHEGASPKAAS